MKLKKFDKKLILNKKTIAHLNNSEMGKIQGGISTILSVCPCVYTETRCKTQCGPGGELC